MQLFDSQQQIARKTNSDRERSTSKPTTPKCLSTPRLDSVHEKISGSTHKVFGDRPCGSAKIKQRMVQILANILTTDIETDCIRTLTAVPNTRRGINYIVG